MAWILFASTFKPKLKAHPFCLLSPFGIEEKVYFFTKKSLTFVKRANLFIKADLKGFHCIGNIYGVRIEHLNTKLIGLKRKKQGISCMNII